MSIFYKRSILSVVLLTICSIISIHAQDSLTSIKPASIYLSEKDKFHIYDENGIVAFMISKEESGIFEISINGKNQEVRVQKGKSVDFQSFLSEGLNYVQTKGQHQLIHFSSVNDKIRVQNIPLWLSIIPPLIAIFLALIFKEVVISLIFGIWSGAFIASGLSFKYFFSSIFNVIDKYIIQSLNDSGHLSVIVFSLLIGGMVALISKNGGMQGIVNSLSKYANNRISAQKTTWLLGIAIFFDDYANTLIVGNTMRSVTDKFKISREKLAYIVDSTAAPVSAVAFITTWIGAELGYIGDGLTLLGLTEITPYAAFLASLKYSFYPILTLVFVFLLIRSGKDFSNMYKAEYRAITKGQVSPARTEDEDEPDMEDLEPVKNAPLIWWHAALPICAVILVTIIGLLTTGFNSLQSSLLALQPDIKIYSWSSIWSQLHLINDSDQLNIVSKLGMVIGASDSYIALLWASFTGAVLALIISISTKTMKLIEGMHWFTTGIKTMIPAILILILAWALAILTDELHTADFITNALQNSIHPYVIPGVVFILAALIAFSTGSSWSTMAILYPIAIPASYAICQSYGLDPQHSMEVLLCVISTVLSASVLGDHISPISDTTILSSLASDCNHIDHVKTQMPYALIVGLISLISMSLAIVLGGGWFICMLCILLATTALFFIISIFGKQLPDNEHQLD